MNHRHDMFARTGMLGLLAVFLSIPSVFSPIVDAQESSLLTDAILQAADRFDADRIADMQQSK